MSEGAPPEPVLEVPPPQDIKILETAEDIQVLFHCFRENNVCFPFVESFVKKRFQH